MEKTQEICLILGAISASMLTLQHSVDLQAQTGRIRSLFTSNDIADTQTNTILALRAINKRLKDIVSEDA